MAIDWTHLVDLLTGACIALTSSILTAVVTHWLALRADRIRRARDLVDNFARERRQALLLKEDERKELLRSSRISLTETEEAGGNSAQSSVNFGEVALHTERIHKKLQELESERERLFEEYVDIVTNIKGRKPTD